MEKIIDPVDKSLIKNELTVGKRIRTTNKANNEIYIFTAHDSPNLMREVGRLREIAFRHYGGGTGLEADIDKYDLMEHPYHQLIVWDPEKEDILGGYRFIMGGNVDFDENGKPMLATAHLLNFSDNFIHNYLPYTVELGRSFVSLEYQSTLHSRKGIFALDNLWDGLGGLIIMHPDIKYFYGKVTMYLKFDQFARDVIMAFLIKHFPDRDNLVWAYVPRPIRTTDDVIRKILHGTTYEEDKTLLMRFVRSRGMNFPPLVNAYMNLTNSMRTFGSSLNDTFGDVEEIGILVTIADIYKSKKHRHLATFNKGRG